MYRAAMRVQNQYKGIPNSTLIQAWPMLSCEYELQVPQRCQ